MIKYTDMDLLLETLDDGDNHYDAIVIEGYDGVGKSKVLQELSQLSIVTPYRPDYNLWQKYGLAPTDRWKISGYFWDIYSHFFRSEDNHPLMLFDRGVVSGAVYNNDIRILEDYHLMHRDIRILTILVTCDLSDYSTFCVSRNPSITHEEILSGYRNVQEYTKRYITMMDTVGIDYVSYHNTYDKDFSETCGGCGHYNYGICMNSESGRYFVNMDDDRCQVSNMKEVQDTI